VKHDQLKEIMMKIELLPSVSNVTAKLLNLLDDPNACPDKLEEILRYDPSLTANILKLSNSAYFGFRSKIGSIKHALAAIGLRRLKKMIITSCMQPVLNKPVPGYGLNPGELWRHSIAVSVISETLAKELDIVASDEIFTAALIHDMGKLVLGEFVKVDMDKIQTLSSYDVSFEAAERLVFGIDHAEIGAMVLKNWFFPEKIVDAVRWHHEPDALSEESVVVDIVHVADLISLIIGIGVGDDGLHYESSQTVIARLGLSNAHLETVASQSLQNINEVLDTFEKS
jgi:putative nucleotidyltransferase with HDIG domain